MTFIAKNDFYVGDMQFSVGDKVEEKYINRMIRELCLVEHHPDITYYTVRLHSNCDPDNLISAETEGFFQLPACTFEPPANMQFKNWAMQANGNGSKKVGDTVNLVMDTDFYAQWVPIVSTIKFNANGATGKMADVKCDKGTMYELPTCTFTPPSCKKFKCWSLNKKDPITKLPASDVTVYAMWQAEEPTK